MHNFFWLIRLFKQNNNNNDNIKYTHIHTQFSAVFAAIQQYFPICFNSRTLIIMCMLEYYYYYRKKKIVFLCLDSWCPVSALFSLVMHICLRTLSYSISFHVRICVYAANRARSLSNWCNTQFSSFFSVSFFFSSSSFDL